MSKSQSKDFYTPLDIEKETGRTGRVIRGRLRKRYPRPESNKNKPWKLTYIEFIQEVNYWTR